jgi:fumarylacetoacetate (FAA) hydrolase
MKLASLKNETRDGALAVVSRDLARATLAYDVAPTLQAALDDWDYCAPLLAGLYEDVNRGAGGSRLFDFDPALCAAPLPRAYQWLDGSAYLSHAELVRRARGAEMPANAKSDPLMYQGDSDYFIGARDPIVAASEDWGIDLEAEVAVILGDVPCGVAPDRAAEQVRLLALVNDISLRNLIPGDMAKGFGFLHGKAATAFSPVALTPDELGEAWDGRRLRLPIRVEVNGELLGSPDCGLDMRFDFPHLIAHAARTRPLGAGAVLAGGTVSNAGHPTGFACIAELRAWQTVDNQEMRSWLRFGDRVRIDMEDAQGRTLFGAIEQVVTPAPQPRKRGEQAAADPQAQSTGT